jgi:nucleotide-binding universal stress UspA family protein
VPARTSSAPLEWDPLQYEVKAISDSPSNADPESGRDPWTTPARILVATDLSDLDRLMPFALDQASETGARLILLHVLTAGASEGSDVAGAPYYDPASALEFARKNLEVCCEFAGRQGIACDGLVRAGDPAGHIAAAIRQFHVGRVLLGTRSRSRLGKLLLGSVAEQVLRSVQLPVFTVGPEAHLAVAGSDRVVLHATALTETSRPSAALACRIAASQGAKLILLHVLPPLNHPESEMLDGFGLAGEGMGRSGQLAGLDSAALHELRHLAAETAAGCCTAIEPVVVHGNPSIEILAIAAERQADLIVMGATDRSAFANLTRERTIYRVLAHARCPVLTLRETHVAPAALEKHSMGVHP